MQCVHVKHVFLPVFGEFGPWPRASFILLLRQSILVHFTPAPSVVPIVRLYAKKMQGYMALCTQKIGKSKMLRIFLADSEHSLGTAYEAICPAVSDGDMPVIKRGAIPILAISPSKSGSSGLQRTGVV